jgi:hypothetical protein
MKYAQMFFCCCQGMGREMTIGWSNKRNKKGIRKDGRSSGHEREQEKQKGKKTASM